MWQDCMCYRLNIRLLNNMYNNNIDRAEGVLLVRARCE